MLMVIMHAHTVIPVHETSLRTSATVEVYCVHSCTRVPVLNLVVLNLVPRGTSMYLRVAIGTAVSSIQLLYVIAWRITRPRVYTACTKGEWN
jgi:hypothetical protein